ncbi:Tigger transposable element-derived protein 4 [Eumeta japonica]|uniref:Tigger transposable element-derived protein 4 n=1 Tax=Eumeta variegata TaxID=151549 RepID=A0A4C1UPD0_EUMVA|nr:Tigger transposable element-derived protein 4 [Eumeta japonica]
MIDVMGVVVGPIAEEYAVQRDMSAASSKERRTARRQVLAFQQAFFEEEKRCTFTVKEKVDIISRLKNGENNVDLCKQFGVSHSTISTMWKNRAKILECFESKSLKIKEDHNPTHQDIENALLVWFKAQRSQNVPISGPLLQKKANHFARQLEKTNFECSGSWIYRFRQLHDIVVGKVCGESTSVSQND